MPTGVALRDAREQLFDAAERILLRDGPNALTSRAVTTEAGCAKGVLHRHFTDFDAFLTDLVLGEAGLAVQRLEPGDRHRVRGDLVEEPDDELRRRLPGMPGGPHPLGLLLEAASVDIVVHCAGPASVPASISDPDADRAGSVGVLAPLLRRLASLRTPPRFVSG